MARASARFRQADLTRALRAAKDAGQAVASCTVGPDGTIEIVFGSPEKLRPENALDAWEKKRSAK
jgi:hypothetical protein